jgi:hypothetical protein
MNDPKCKSRSSGDRAGVGSFLLMFRGRNALKRGVRAVQSHESRTAQNRLWALEEAVCGGPWRGDAKTRINHDDGISGFDDCNNPRKRMTVVGARHRRHKTIMNSEYGVMNSE